MYFLKQYKTLFARINSYKSHYENVPFEIPENWCWTTLGEVFTLQAGKNITAKEISDKQDTIYPFPCYGGNGLRGYVSSYNRTGRFPLIGRQGALCGNINVADGLFYATEHAVVVESYCNIDVDWAVYALIYLNLNQYATSTAQPGLSVATINEVLLPVPPNDEQKRIANEIEKWFDLIKEIESGKVELKSYIKQTKSKILDLAISGKLVPQDPNDEPAIELLKRINPGFQSCDNSHYENLPQGWTVCKIKDIFNITMGQSPTGESINGVNGIEFHQGKIHFTESYLSQSSVYTDQPTKIVEVDSLLLCVRAPVGVLNITQRKICIGRGLCALKPKYEIDNLYWLFILSAYKDYFESNATGSTFKAISGDTIKNAVIKLPPLQEQKRILSSIISLYESLDAITAEL